MVAPWKRNCQKSASVSATMPVTKGSVAPVGGKHRLSRKLNLAVEVNSVTPVQVSQVFFAPRSPKSRRTSNIMTDNKTGQVLVHRTSGSHAEKAALFRAQTNTKCSKL